MESFWFHSPDTFAQRRLEQEEYANQLMKAIIPIYGSMLSDIDENHAITFLISSLVTETAKYIMHNLNTYNCDYDLHIHLLVLSLKYKNEAILPFIT